MQRLRVPALPALLVALCGFAALGAEAGHSRAHRDGHDTAGHHHEEVYRAPAASAATLEAGHAAADHLHPDLRAIVPPRILAPGSPGLDPLTSPAVLVADARRIHHVISHGLAPPQQAQAPPPPSRSPPQV